MTNLTLTREMQNMAERLAENSHDIWAKKKKEELMICGNNLRIIKIISFVFCPECKITIRTFSFRWRYS